MELPRGVELEHGEQAIGRWACGIPNSPGSSIVKHEGTLVLTNRRIVYAPMRAPKPWASMLGGERQSFPLTDVERAEAPEGRQPRLRLVFASGDPFTVSVSTGRFSAPWSKRKWIVLEQALGAINSQVDALAQSA